ncbi:MULTISPECIES: RraA family protein [unclassified Chelatococcus]|uniref:RraA family protein n=1 Tax=unclassified Chelatococcus TaxID=2638111 RepID=UPI001BCD2F1B|nr:MULTISPECIES: RraA family protein [unclassified Chelatococcus]MBS7700487.1 RraA family protein [Chelatococcus sp. YT9]MBX3556283.1 RraA family protein [Chelatococcus sp.]
MSGQLDANGVDTRALQREAGMMKLERLIAEREIIDTTPFAIPVKDLLARYERLYTGAISDVMREFCLMNQALPGYLQPLRPERTVAGVAFTVKSAPNTKVTGELTYRTQMLDEIGEDTFVIWDTSGDTESTAWGGVMTATAIGKGIKAAAIDGGIRDTHQILQKDFPIFYKYRSPNGSLGRCLITHYQIPIKFGSVMVRPGDVIVGDIDGVIVVPHNVAVDVLLRAEEILNNEKQIFQWVEEGNSIQEITRKGGYF